MKQRFVLRCPTAAPPPLKRAWDAQIAGLKKLVALAEAEYTQKFGENRIVGESKCLHDMYFP